MSPNSIFMTVYRILYTKNSNHSYCHSASNTSTYWATWYD